MNATRFDTYACIDWSGAATERPQGIALAHCATGSAAPTLLRPTGGWSRPAVLDWLTTHAAKGTNILIGLDLSPALPFVDHDAYFPNHPASPQHARALWAMVDALCTEEPHLSASTFPLREGLADHFRNHGNTGSAFGNSTGRLRAAEHAQRAQGLNPVSCLNLVGAAQVGKSSLTGMRLLHRLGGQIPVWPIDPIPETGPVIVEIYTTIAARAGGIPKGRSKIRDAATLDTTLSNLASAPHTPLTAYDDHSTDALITAAWLRANAHRADLWHPPALTEKIARTEGWTFGAI